MALKRYDEETFKAMHGDYEGYRKLYKGLHHELFERAQDLLKEGELFTDRETKKSSNTANVKTPYLTINVCKLIVDTPTGLITHSLGDVVSAFSDDPGATSREEREEAEGVAGGRTDDIEEAEGEQNDVLSDIQQERIDQITKNSDIDHQKILTQLHIDGGIVGVPEYDDGRIEIVFKERNVYYKAGKNVEELHFIVEHEKKRYTHIHRETIQNGGLLVQEELYKLNSKSERGDTPEDESLTREVLGIDRSEYVIKGRKNFLIAYLPYNPTFIDPLGVSVLEGQADKQEEINWTVTRAAQTFERNGKPRISISQETMGYLQNLAQEATGDPFNIDHRNLEITTMNEKGESIEYHQIDITKIGNMEHVKEIIKAMLMETNTSIKAVDFVAGQSSNQSGKAKFYDWATSIINASQLRNRYVDFIQTLYENALWLLNYYNEDVVVERPHIVTFDLSIKSSEEKTDEEIKKYAAGTQSLETTVRNINPTRSNDWILEEIERIESEAATMDTMSITRGMQSMRNMNDNIDYGTDDPESTQEGGEGRNE